MAARKRLDHKAVSGDYGRVHGFKREPEIWRDGEGEWHVVGELADGARVIITHREADLQPVKRSRRRRAASSIAGKYRLISARVQQKST